MSPLHEINSKRRVNAGGNVFAFHQMYYLRCTSGRALSDAQHLYLQHSRMRSVRFAPRHIGCPDPWGESASVVTESNARFRRVYHPHGRKMKPRHGRHATCRTSSPGIAKWKEFIKQATFEQEDGKQQSELEGVRDATASAHLYKASCTFQTS